MVPTLLLKTQAQPWEWAWRGTSLLRSEFDKTIPSSVKKRPPHLFLLEELGLLFSEPCETFSLSYLFPTAHYIF